MRKALFNNYSNFLLLIFFILIILVSWITFTLLGTFIGSFIFHYNIQTIAQDIYTQPATMKYFQTIQSISLFIVPTILFAYIFYKKPFDWLTLNHKPEFLILIATLTLTIIAQPFISFTGEINSNLSLPSFMKPIENWMRLKETQAQLATNIFLSSSSWYESIFNIILIAVIPAFGEELLFRGTIQKLILNSTKKIHLSVWITAILFSALHIQFFGFVPRLILGLLFGYLVVYFDCIWLSITAHFTNNFLAYLIYQNSDLNKVNETNAEKTSDSTSYLFIILSIIGVCIVSYLLFRYKKQKSSKRQKSL